jgi:LmbE family N-acetylglucosaminyl deacetylase
LVIAVILAASSSYLHGIPKVEGLASPGASTLGSRVLVVAPHPDDEGLAMAGLIRQILAERHRVKVAIMTSGDGDAAAVQTESRKSALTPADFRATGTARVRESTEAMARLGLPSSDLILLGYPDGGLNSLWDVNWDYDNLHHGLNGADYSPYSFSFQKNAPYCGQNVVKNLESIIEAYKPSSIVYPDAEDEHHDHWAANAFVQYALADTRYRTKEFTYLVHRYDYPEPKGFAPGASLRPPPGFMPAEDKWQSFPLSAKDEKAKEGALGCYAIPRMRIGGFIESFVRKNELLATSTEGTIDRVDSKAPALDSEPMPYLVEGDPFIDMTTPLHLHGSQLRRVSFVLGESVGYFGVESWGPISPSLAYAFRLRLFGGRGVKRVDVDVGTGKASYRLLAHNSLALHGHIPVHESSRRLWIELPASIFRGRTQVMLNVDVMRGKHQTDRSSWRRYRI